jgi:hypothetical protein
MAEEKNTTNQNTTTNTDSKEKQTNSDSSKSVEKETQEQEPEKEPSLAEDYEALKNMNLLKNIMIRMQLGKYPNKKIEGILKRRMDFDESKYQGPQIVRMIITIMAMFFICSFLYVVIWLIASNLELNSLKETSSLILSLFFLGSCGFALFNNLSVPDEKKLKEAIKEKMAEIEKELKNTPKENDKNNTEKQSKTDNNNTK